MFCTIICFFFLAKAVLMGGRRHATGFGFVLVTEFGLDVRARNIKLSKLIEIANNKI